MIALNKARKLTVKGNKLTVREAASMWGVSEEQMLCWCSEGHVRCEYAAISVTFWADGRFEENMEYLIDREDFENYMLNGIEMN
jgi:hypothetical protein